MNETTASDPFFRKVLVRLAIAIIMITVAAALVVVLLAVGGVINHTLPGWWGTGVGFVFVFGGIYRIIWALPDIEQMLRELLASEPSPPHDA